MRTIFVGLLLLTSLALWAADKFHPLNVKPGLWETTSTITHSGEMPIPAEFMAKLTPEQRARVEARMKANSAQKTTTHSDKSCMTREKLQEAPFSDEKEHCTNTIVSSSSSKAEFKFACGMEEAKAEGKVAVEALSPEYVKGIIETNATGGGHTFNTSGTFTSKWLGPNCGDVK